MKSYLMIVTSCLLLTSNVMAQNSAVETAQFQTKAEIFLNECLYYC